MWNSTSPSNRWNERKWYVPHESDGEVRRTKLHDTRLCISFCAGTCFTHGFPLRHSQDRTGGSHAHAAGHTHLPQWPVRQSAPVCRMQHWWVVFLTNWFYEMIWTVLVVQSQTVVMFLMFCKYIYCFWRSVLNICGAVDGDCVRPAGEQNLATSAALRSSSCLQSVAGSQVPVLDLGIMWCE